MSQFYPWVEVDPTVVPLIQNGFVFQVEFYDETSSFFQSPELMMGTDYTLQQWAELAETVKRILAVHPTRKLGIYRYRIKRPEALEAMKRAIRQVPVAALSKKGARRPPVTT